MSFKVERLAVLSNTTKRGIMPLVWQYWNKDGDTVTSAEYFDTDKLEVGDQILIINADYLGNAWYNVKTASAKKDKFTAAANS